MKKSRFLACLVALCLFLTLSCAALEGASETSVDTSTLQDESISTPFSLETSEFIVPSDTNGVYIDLDTESIVLPTDFVVSEYSVDGGKKWYSHELPTEKNLTKLFDDELTLWVKNTDNSTIKFPKINQRPKSNPDKLVINYAICADSTGNTTGAWTLAPKKSDIQTINGYQMAFTQDGKTPDSAWSSLPINGTPVTTGKTKISYVIRTAPIIESYNYTPASKAYKITPARAGKATTYKPDYKKESIKLSKGDNYQVGSTVVYDLPKNPDLLDVSEAISYQKNVYIWKNATAKKPATEKQILDLRNRSQMGNVVLECEDGKLKSKVKIYEFYNEKKDKWGSMPKVTESISMKIRLKSTKTNAPSLVGEIAFTYSDGIVDATITPNAQEGSLSFGISENSEITLKKILKFGYNKIKSVFKLYKKLDAKLVKFLKMVVFGNK